MQDNSKRKRMKLNLESIEVDSFATLPKELPRGTVKGHESEWAGVCEWSAGWDCGSQLWVDPTCGTCPYTCSPACRSDVTYMSCGGSCDATNCPGEAGCSEYPCQMM